MTTQILWSPGCECTCGPIGGPCNNPLDGPAPLTVTGTFSDLPAWPGFGTNWELLNGEQLTIEDSYEYDTQSCVHLWTEETTFATRKTIVVDGNEEWSYYAFGLQYQQHPTQAPPAPFQLLLNGNLVYTVGGIVNDTFQFVPFGNGFLETPEEYPPALTAAQLFNGTRCYDMVVDGKLCF